MCDIETKHEVNPARNCANYLPLFLQLHCDETLRSV